MKHAFAWRATAFAGVVLGLVSSPVLAQSANDEIDHRQMAVHYHDHDLATAKGRARLETRLERAAAMVCGYDNGETPWKGDDDGRACYNTALVHAHTALAAAAQPREMVTR